MQGGLCRSVRVLDAHRVTLAIPGATPVRAKPEIWQPQNKADFATKLHNFQVAAPRFNAAVSGTDVGAIKARFAELGGTCKACHDKYRTEMHH